MSTFTQMGYWVGLLLTETAPYDLVVDTKKGVKRVSVKFLGSKSNSLDLRGVHYNASGVKIKKVKKNDYDWLYIYTKEGDEYLIKECLAGRSSIIPQKEHLLREKDKCL